MLSVTAIKDAYDDIVSPLAVVGGGEGYTDILGPVSCSERRGEGGWEEGCADIVRPASCSRKRRRRRICSVSSLVPRLP